MHLQIYRYSPDDGQPPRMQDYRITPDPADRKLLDVLIRIKTIDDSLSFRRSCREGVCGSDALNINGRNGLACLTPIEGLREPVLIRPLPGLPVIRDLVVNMTQFFAHYHEIKPYLINDTALPERERLQTPEQRERLGWSVRMHPLCLLQHLLPFLLVESKQVHRSSDLCGPIGLS